MTFQTSNRLLYLVRHGQTASNLRRTFGRSDDPLTEEGRSEVSALASRLEGSRPDRFVTSPLARTVETASILACSLGMKPSLEDRLVEARCGLFAGMTWKEACRLHPEIAQEVVNTGSWGSVPGAESFEAVRARARSWVDSLRMSGSSESSTLAVTHAGFMNALLWDELGTGTFHSFKNAGMTVVVLDPEGGLRIEAIDLGPEEVASRVPVFGG